VTGTRPHKAKHGLGATRRKTATAEIVKMGFIWEALHSAVVKFDERRGTPHAQLSTRRLGSHLGDLRPPNVRGSGARVNDAPIPSSRTAVAAGATHNRLLRFFGAWPVGSSGWTACL